MPASPDDASPPAQQQHQQHQHQQHQHQQPYSPTLPRTHPSSNGSSGGSKARAGAQHLREVGGLAAWSVTSAKPGNGVELLRDGSTDTYWQSDGTQPHLVNIQFNRRMEVSELRLYLDYKADESYTPCRLSIRAGCSFHDLKDICIVEMREPCGWVTIPLTQQQQQQQQPGTPAERPLRAFFYQVAVLANHQNGRDTHVRQISLFGPSAQAGSGVDVVPVGLRTLECSRYGAIR